MIDFTSRGRALSCALAASSLAVAPVLLCAESVRMLLALQRAPEAALWAALAFIHAWLGISFALRALGDTDFAFDRAGFPSAILRGGLTGLSGIAAFALVWSLPLFNGFAIDHRLRLAVAFGVVLLLLPQRWLLAALPAPKPLYLGHR